MKKRLDEAMVERGLVFSRSQAQRLIKMGKVNLAGVQAKKPNQMTYKQNSIEIIGGETYVSRAGFKLASVAEEFKLDFKDRTVLDVGSSTGGFTDFALQNGAKKVIAVDVGKKQLHPSLRTDPRVELYEQTDIREVRLGAEGSGMSDVGFRAEETVNGKPETGKSGHVHIKKAPDIVVIDVSFISMRQILPHIARLCSSNTQIVAMFKPQFEAGNKLKNKGVIKNDTMRRDIIKSFETWLRGKFVIINKKDSEVAGQKGNLERFYLLKITRRP